LTYCAQIQLDDIARGAKALEVEGLAKPLAARIMALAGGGQTLLSAAAYVALDAQALNGAEIERHGHAAGFDLFSLTRIAACRFS
jgi:class 3 adenylate cyclase